MRPRALATRLLLLFSLCLIPCAPALAVQVIPNMEEEGRAAPKEVPAKIEPKVEERQSRTRHELRIGDRTYNYTATAGEMLLSREEGREPSARLFYVAYELEGAEPGQRPLTFAFNGGPGAASVWLHLGGLGPRRVALNDDGTLPPPPYSLADNESSWLPFTDLVFIDPVGTGYSRGLGEAKPAGRPFWSLSEDVASVSEFVRLWLTRHGRWLSPLFLCGESYGTTRAAMMAPFLQERFGIQAAGILLVSPVLSYETILPAPNNDLPYALYLPAFAAVAHFHGKAGQGIELDRLLQEAGAFALEEYLTALAKGDVLPLEREEAVARRLADFTGLPAEMFRKNRLRLTPSRFRRELLADEGLLVGRMDATVASVSPTGQEMPGFDPTLRPLFGPFSSTMHDYLARDLRFHSDLYYEILNYEVVANWDWQAEGPEGRSYLDAATPLREAMIVSPRMRVLLACGLYDLATPCSAAEYTVNHLGLDAKLKDNVQVEYYLAGHMMYTHAQARGKLRADAELFYQITLARPNQGRIQ